MPTAGVSRRPSSHSCWRWPGVRVSGELGSTRSGRTRYYCVNLLCNHIDGPRRSACPLQLIGLVIGLGMSLSGHAQLPQTAPAHSPSGHPVYAAQPAKQQSVSVVDLKSLPETIGIEHADRKNRFARMALMFGVQPPEVDEMQLGTGEVVGFNFPIPVVRARFDERTFFDFDRDTIRPDSMKVLDVIAENMKRDVPDVQLTILGHTDAIGSDAYNYDLSRRRAAGVMQALIERGCNPAQMSTVAVGKMQPIAPNSTDEGRARNRRVEFMISASEQANLALVSKRRIVLEFLAVNPNAKQVRTEAAQLEVLKPLPRAASAIQTPLQLLPIGTVQGKRPMPEAEVGKLAPMPDAKRMPLKEFEQARLNREFEL